jgi:hypothetical protein
MTVRHFPISKASGVVEDAPTMAGAYAGAAVLALASVIVIWILATAVMVDTLFGLH